MSLTGRKEEDVLDGKASMTVTRRSIGDIEAAANRERFSRGVHIATRRAALDQSDLRRRRWNRGGRRPIIGPGVDRQERAGERRPTSTGRRADGRGAGDLAGGRSGVSYIHFRRFVDFGIHFIRQGGSNIAGSMATASLAPSQKETE